MSVSQSAPGQTSPDDLSGQEFDLCWEGIKANSHFFAVRPPPVALNLTAWLPAITKSSFYY